jgi:putative peptide zinc metalloprotease protein
VLLGLASAVTFSKWPEFWQAAKNSIDPSNWLLLWITFAVIKFIHELGHAFTCRKFGGEVHEMGIMFLVFIPTPYVDASSAWGFPNKWHRIVVGAGGMLFELVVAAFAVFVWAMTNPQVPVWGLPVNQLAYNIMLIASVSTILFNINPLLRYDGYYILSDYLEIPNLQRKSTEYTMGIVKRHVFRVKQREPLPTPLARIWLASYACTSSVYRVAIGLFIILLVAYQIPILGILMAVGGMVMWLGMPLYKSIKYLALEPELHRKRSRAWAFTLAFCALVVIGVGYIPVWFAVRAEAIVEPERREMVHSRSPGFVEQILVKDQQDVAAGDVLLVMNLEVRRRMALTSTPAEVALAEAELTFAKQTLDELLRRQDDLVLRAPLAGRVIAPTIEEYQGRYVQRGEQVLIVASLDKLLVRASIPQTDAELVPLDRPIVVEAVAAGATPWGWIAPLSPVRLLDPHLVAAAQESLPHPALGQAGGGEIAIDSSDPSGARPQVKPHELWARLPAGSDIKSGQRAYIRVELPPRPIGWQVWRRFLQLIQSNSNTYWR